MRGAGSSGRGSSISGVHTVGARCMRERGVEGIRDLGLGCCTGEHGRHGRSGRGLLLLGVKDGHGGCGGCGDHGRGRLGLLLLGVDG